MSSVNKMSNKIPNVLSKGIFAVYKHKDISSAQVVREIKNELCRVTCINDSLKVGHGGVLDHTATGVLVLGTGVGCKLLQNFLHGPKGYVVTGRLGVGTETYNETGAVAKESPYDFVTTEMILDKLDQFRGRILQVPPKYSTLKRGGERLYNLVKRGIELDLKPRPVHCYELQLTSFSPPYFTLSVETSSGFYVRSLVHDLGIALGTCAHVTQLHRSWCGDLTDEEALHAPDWTYDKIVQSICHTRKIYPNCYRTFKKKDMLW